MIVKPAKLQFNRWLNIFILVLFVASSQSFGAETRIRPYHIIKITVSGHPEFSEAVDVKRDGTTEYPLMAGIPLDGLTAEDVKELLRSILLRFDMEPDIFVVVSEQQRVNFQVFGEVTKPGNFGIDGSLNLQQAIALSGGITEDGDPLHILILRIENEQRIEHEVNLNTYFMQDSLIIPPEVHDGDIIAVPKKLESRSVRILGIVSKPGLYDLMPGDNILDIIERAGGSHAFYSGYAANYSSNITSTSGDMKRVIHITHIDNRQVHNTVNINKFVQDGEYEKLPKVSPGDIIIVPQTDHWRDPWFVISRITTVISFILTILTINNALS